MTHALVLYNTPADPAAFDRYYAETHIPLAKKLPGLRGYHINNGAIHALTGTAPYLIAQLDFNSMADLQAALSSPEGQATAGDLANFATGGVTILFFDGQSV